MNGRSARFIDALGGLAEIVTRHIERVHQHEHLGRVAGEPLDISVLAVDRTERPSRRMAPTRLPWRRRASRRSGSRAYALAESMMWWSLVIVGSAVIRNSNWPILVIFCLTNPFRPGRLAGR